MSDERLEKFPRYPYVVQTEWLRKLCGLAGLEVVDAVDSLAWRFMALRDPANQPAIDAVLSDSLTRLRSEGTSPRRFAVIAPMPPAQTGIANATRPIGTIVVASTSSRASRTFMAMPPS